MSLLVLNSPRASLIFESEKNSVADPCKYGNRRGLHSIGYLLCIFDRLHTSEFGIGLAGRIFNLPFD